MFDPLLTPLPFAQAAGSGGLGQILFMLVAFGAIVYFLMIRPQQQQRKKHEEMIESLKRGDHIILQSGLYGNISRIHDDILEVEIAPDVIVNQVKSMVLSVDVKPLPQKARPAKTASASAGGKSSPKKQTTPRPKKSTTQTTK